MSKERNYKGYMVSFPVGVNQDIMQVNLVIAEDDGTWADHLILKFNDIPYATVPIVNKEGLERVIDALKRIYKDYPEEKK